MGNRAGKSKAATDASEALLDAAAAPQKTVHIDTSGYLIPNRKEVHVETAVEQKAHEAASAYHTYKFSIDCTQMYWLKWLAIVLIVPALVILFGLWIFKGASDTPEAYVHYFTNVMWTVNTFFYAGLILSFLDRTGTVQFIWFYAVWWPVFGNVNLVFFAVLALLWLNPQIVVESGEQFGWPITFEVERLVHVDPFCFIWFITILLACDHKSVLRRFPVNTPRERWELAGFILVNIFNANLIVLGYCFTFDFNAVYHVDIEMWQALILIEIILIPAIAGPILYLAPSGNYLTMAAKEMIKSDHPAMLVLHETNKTRPQPPMSKGVDLEIRVL